MKKTKTTKKEKQRKNDFWGISTQLSSGVCSFMLVSNQEVSLLTLIDKRGRRGPDLCWVIPTSLQ